MNLQHEAILSLNTRVRRLRYLQKAIEFVSDTPISHQLLVSQLVEYGLSRSLYEEITQKSGEPFSGHFFENVSYPYERNMEKRSARRATNAERVADSYIALGLRLGLLVEVGKRLSAAQLSMPMRFLANSEWLPPNLQSEFRNRFFLALLWRFDRDLTCPMLTELASSPHVSISLLESDWDTWINKWLNKLIELSSQKSLGNPSELLRYVRNSAKSRKNPRRYAEHTALIRFHWFIDLGIATGEPLRNPALFRPKDIAAALRKLISEFSPYVISGDLARIHFQICKVTSEYLPSMATKVPFSVLITHFLKAAHRRGLSNIRLNLLDIVWTSVLNATAQLPSDFETFSSSLDSLLKAEGVAVVRAPRRDESYIPTGQR